MAKNGERYEMGRKQDVISLDTQLLSYAPNRITVVATIVTGWIDIASIRVEVVHIAITAASRGTEDAARPLIARRAIVEPAREGQMKSGAVVGVSIVTGIIV